MKINLKSFMLGALAAAIPMSFFVYRSIPVHSVLSAKHESNNLAIADIAVSLTSTPKPLPQATNTPQATSTPKPEITKTEKMVASYEVHTPQAPVDVNILIDKYSAQYGVDKYMMVSIAKCESGFRSNAVNGPYAGIYQFVSSTWVSNRRAMGLDPDPALRFNADESVKTAAFKMSRDGFGAWPVCSRKALSLKQ